MELYEKARVIVTHGGAGTILTLSNFNKKIIVVPRLKKFNEHVDDHQLELAEFLEKEKKVTVVYDIEDLHKSLCSVKEFSIKSNNDLGIFLKKYIMIIDQ